MAMNYKYLNGYPENILKQVDELIKEGKLKNYILGKYPKNHNIKSSKELYNYTVKIKNEFMKKAPPISKVEYSDRAEVLQNALGLHKFINRVHGNKIKKINEILVSSVFINAPEEFLRMVVVHELAHFKEKEHNKAFYALCQNMMSDYFQIEFDMRLFLTLSE